MEARQLLMTASKGGSSKDDEGIELGNLTKGQSNNNSTIPSRVTSAKGGHSKLILND